MEDQADRQEFCRRVDVSRETLSRLDEYASLLRKWSKTINLVSNSTLPKLWTRHFLDSSQLFDLKQQNSGVWADLGSGGGFPGMVCAVMAKQSAPKIQFKFVESDQRKSAFLRTVARTLSLNVSVITDRIEEIEPLAANILSARALAPLETLLGYAEIHLAKGGQALFMKGASYSKEQNETLENWQYQSDEYRSVTDGAAVVLSLGDIKRV